MKKFLVPLTLTIPLILASCNNAAISTADITSQTNVPTLLTQANANEIALGQAIALKSALTSGLNMQALSKKSATSLIVYDLYEQPFYQVNLISDQKGNFWEALDKSVKRREKVRVSLTGANDIRQLNVLDSNETLANSLNELRSKFGNGLKLYSPRGSVLYAKHGNTFYDLSGKEVSAAQLDDDRVQYSSLVEQISQDTNYLKATRELWQSLKSNLNQQSLDSSVSPLRYTDAEGNLDFSSFTKAAQDAPARLTGQEANDYIRCEGFLCNVKVRAAMRNSSGPLSGSVYDDPSTTSTWWNNKTGDFNNQQYATSSSSLVSSLSADKPKSTWGIRSANPFNTATTNWDVTGCAATAFMRLANINQIFDNTFASKANATVGTDASGNKYTLVQWLARPVQADGLATGFYEAYTTQRMGGGEFMGGTLITPPGFYDGANAIMNDLGLTSGDARYAVVGDGYFNLAGNSALGNAAKFLGGLGLSSDFNRFTWTVNGNVRWAVGEQSRPVVYLYTVGGANGYGGHFSISHAYRSWDNWAYSDVYVYNDGTENVANNTTGWLNITNRWDTYGGAYAIVRTQ